MFDKNFYPTPPEVIERMFEDLDIQGKVVYEPHAGKGDIVKFAKNLGAEVIASELNDDLRSISQKYCVMIGTDFLKVTSDQISHVDIIAMNPPFDRATQHLQHAISIAPKGCRIIALCNAATLENTKYSDRKEMITFVEANGNWENIGSVFSDAERTTDVEVGLIKLVIPGKRLDAEFDGFSWKRKKMNKRMLSFHTHSFVTL